MARRVEPRVRSARLRPRQRIAAVGVRSLCVCGRRLRDAGRRTGAAETARLPPARACRSPRTCVMPPITNRSSSCVHGGVSGPSSRRDPATQSRPGGPSFPTASASGAGRTGSIARTSPVTNLRRRKRRNRPRRSRMRRIAVRSFRESHDQRPRPCRRRPRCASGGLGDRRRGARPEAIAGARQGARRHRHRGRQRSGGRDRGDDSRCLSRACDPGRGIRPHRRRARACRIQVDRATRWTAPRTSRTAIRISRFR